MIYYELNIFYWYTGNYISVSGMLSLVADFVLLFFEK